MTDQPKDDETILHCGHLGSAGHWFKYDAPLYFERPDGTRGESAWLTICDPCFVKHGTHAHVRGDVRWTGDEPAFEKMEN